MPKLKDEYWNSMSNYLLTKLTEAKSGEMVIDVGGLVKEALEEFPFASGYSMEQLEQKYWLGYVEVMANKLGFRSIETKVFANYENATNQELDMMILNAQTDVDGRERMLRKLCSEKERRDSFICDGQMEFDLDAVVNDYEEVPMLYYARIGSLMSM